MGKLAEPNGECVSNISLTKLIPKTFKIVVYSITQTLNSETNDLKITLEKVVDLLEIIQQLSVLTKSQNQEQITFNQLQNFVILQLIGKWGSLISPLSKITNILPIIKEIELSMIGFVVHNRMVNKIQEIREILFEKRIQFLYDIQPFQTNARELYRKIQGIWKQFETLVSELLLAKTNADIHLSKLIDNSIKLISQLDQQPLQQKSKTKAQSIPEPESSYQTIQNDIQSLRRIIRYINQALKCIDKPDFHPYVIERVMQVIGESVKNSGESRNLGQESRLLLEKANLTLENIQNLRNVYSHSNVLDLDKRQNWSTFLQFTFEAELAKLHKTFSSRLNRIEFHFIRQTIASATGIDENLAAEIHECQNYAELENNLYNVNYQGESSNSPVETLYKYIQTLAKFDEIILSIKSYETELADSTRETQNLFNAILNMNRIGSSKSVITSVSTLRGLNALHADFQFKKNLNKENQSKTPKSTVTSETLYYCIYEVIFKLCGFSEREVFTNACTEIGIGIEEDLNHDTLENNLPDDEEFTTNRKELIKLLSILNKVKYIEKYGTDLVKKAELEITLKNALLGEVITNDVDSLSTNLEVDQTIMYKVLLEMNPRKIQVITIEKILNHVVKEVGLDEFENFIEQSRTISNAKEKLISFLSQKPDPVFSSLEQFNEAIRLMKPNQYLTGDLYSRSGDISSNRNTEKALKFLKTNVLPIDKLELNLIKSTTIKDSVKYWSQFLDTPGSNLATDTIQKAKQVFLSQETERVENHLITKIHALGNILQKLSILKMNSEHEFEVTEQNTKDTLTLYLSTPSRLAKSRDLLFGSAIIAVIAEIARFTGKIALFMRFTAICLGKHAIYIGIQL